MFGFKRKKHPEIVLISSEIEINARAADVFACIDPRSPVNRYTRRGWRMNAASENPNAVIGFDPAVPDLVIVFDVTEAATPHQLAVHTEFADGQPVGSLQSGNSIYRLKDLPGDKCHVELQESSCLVAGLSKRQIEQETLMLAVAVNDDLVRLKAVLEQGADAANKAGAFDALFEELNARRA